MLITDPYFRVEVISQTPNPQQTAWIAAHQDYSESFVHDEKAGWPSEAKSGELIIQHLLKGGRGHYGPLEHPQITLNLGWFPHSTMQQIRTHRVGLSFDCQSFRYTGERIYNLGKTLAESRSGAVWDHNTPVDLIPSKKELQDQLEQVFYLRPCGQYFDRKGKKYEYTLGKRFTHLWHCADAAFRYFADIEDGLSEEHARGLIPFDVRQHWVMSCNMRSLMHLLVIRGKKDAQLECQQLCELVLPHFEAWAPEVYDWFMENLWLKGRLAP